MSAPAISFVTATVADLALSDLALNAAIELERFQARLDSDLHSVGELAKALSEGALTNFALVPVYDRALSSGGNRGPSSKSDLYSRLQSIAKKMLSTKTATREEIEIIRDFCVALHDALLTYRLQTLRQPMPGQKRVA